MVNKDTVSKQEDKLQKLKTEVQTTDESIQTEQLLNLQLSTEHNTIMTDLSHILNQRNSLLLECEGLKDTIVLLHNHFQETAELVKQDQLRKETLKQQLDDIEKKITSWKQDYETVISQYQQRILHT